MGYIIVLVYIYATSATNKIIIELTNTGLLTNTTRNFRKSQAMQTYCVRLVDKRMANNLDDRVPIGSISRC